MACKKVLLHGKTVILLNGYRKPAGASDNKSDKDGPAIEAEKDLHRSASRHPDAVAFGFVAGRWMPGA